MSHKPRILKKPTKNHAIHTLAGQNIKTNSTWTPIVPPIIIFLRRRVIGSFATGPYLAPLCRCSTFRISRRGRVMQSLHRIFVSIYRSFPADSLPPLRPLPALYISCTFGNLIPTPFSDSPMVDGPAYLPATQFRHKLGHTTVFVTQTHVPRPICKYY